jgi:hypothetical protein
VTQPVGDFEVAYALAHDLDPDSHSPAALGGPLPEPASAESVHERARRARLATRLLPAMFDTLHAQGWPRSIDGEDYELAFDGPVGVTLIRRSDQAVLDVRLALVVQQRDQPADEAFESYAAEVRSGAPGQPHPAAQKLEDDAAEALRRGGRR